MSKPLFRPEVFQARASAWMGRIVLRPPRFGWWLLVAGAASVILLALIALFGHYTRTERGTGVVLPMAGIITVSPSVNGTLTAVSVIEGQDVAKGQVLATVTNARYGAAGADTGSRILADLENKRARFEEDLASAATKAARQKTDILGQIAFLAGQIRELEEQSSMQQQRADSAEMLYKKYDSLGHSGLISGVQLLNQKDAFLQNKVAASETKRQLFDARQRMQVLQTSLVQLPATEQQVENELHRQITDVNTAIAEAGTQREVVLRSPARGRIENILVHLGDGVTQGQNLMSVVPADSPMDIELWVPGRAIAFMSTGSAVTLRYDAYPYRKFGQYKGIVAATSSAPVDAATLTKATGRKFEEAAYKVMVRPVSQHILVEGKQRRLTPGLLVQADVQVERRPIYEWLFYQSGNGNAASKTDAEGD